jgi:hypothetical protein
VQKYAIGSSIEVITDPWAGLRTFTGWVVVSNKDKTLILRRDEGARFMVGFGGVDLRQVTLKVQKNVPLAKVLVARRGDGYVHYAVVSGRRSVLINAGCQRFKGVAAARRHWKNRRRFPSAWSKYHRDWIRGKFVCDYNTAAARKKREKDLRWNKWSLAFVRKVERLAAKY